MLGRRDDADAASFASGLLIGADVAARLARAPDDTVHILADPGIGALYAAAIEAQGRTAPMSTVTPPSSPASSISEP